MGELISKQMAIEALKKIDQELWGIDIERSTVPEYIEHHEQIKAVRTIVQDLIDKILDESSAQEWIPFKMRPLTEEEEKMYPDWSWMMDCETPEDGEDILVSDGKFTWADTWYSGYFCCLESDHELEGCAWMSFPKPWKGEENGTT